MEAAAHSAGSSRPAQQRRPSAPEEEYPLQTAASAPRTGPRWGAWWGDRRLDFCVTGPRLARVRSTGVCRKFSPARCARREPLLTSRTHAENLNFCWVRDLILESLGGNPKPKAARFLCHGAASTGG
eukprot:6581890-Prymnesium_polylepis.2